MKRNRLRTRKYGLGYTGYGLATLACIGTYVLLLFLFDNEDAAFVVMQPCIYLIFGCLIVFELRLTDRQMARDLEEAKAAIRRPLRNVVFGMQKPIDFDPHFLTVWPGGGIVSAIDPRRRTMCWITCRLIDKDGNALLDGGHIDGAIAEVTQSTLPAKRRCLGLLPSKIRTGSIELSVVIADDDRNATTWKFRFLPDDHAVEGWRRTFEQWTHEDRKKAPA